MMGKPFSQPRLQSSQGHFSKVPQADIPRSVFNRSHQYKTTFNAGDLIPFFVDEALPGDSFNLRATTFARISTLVNPFMDNLYCDVFFFAVPNRLVWTHWENFNGAQANPGDSTSYLIPTVAPSAGTSWAVGSLWDYFGLPTGVNDPPAVSALHSRAYNLIWNEWFRDQNLQNSVTVDKGDGPDTASNYTILKRGKRHDYFTSSLPWTQKGPAVTLPLGTSAPVYGNTGLTNSSNIQVFQGYNLTDSAVQYGSLSKAGATFDVVLGTPWTGAAAGDSLGYLGLGTKAQYTALGSQYQPPYADLSTATAATINQLREAFQLQRMFERDARGGTRYVEILKSHFGVTSPDFRLQRPEYLGGGSTPINQAPIPQTSNTAAGVSPQGNLAAIGTFSHSGVGFTKSFVEHCVIIGLLSVRADLTYQQGLNRMWSRSTRYDFYWPALSHLGEQAVLNKEIYAQGAGGGTADAGVFGYQERYAEYRYKPSLITGQFRSTYSTPLDSWHLAQKFTSLPTLGNTFIQENPPMSRVKAVTTAPDFLLDVSFDLKCARPMPVYSVPGLIDHF